MLIISYLKKKVEERSIDKADRINKRAEETSNKKDRINKRE